MPYLRMIVTDEIRDELDAVCKRNNVDLVDVFRRALSLYDYLTQERIDGKQIVVRDAEGREELIDLFLFKRRSKDSNT